MGFAAIDPEFDGRLRAAYARAMDKGLWKETYAATNHKEYWAEGVQSYFDCNAPPAWCPQRRQHAREAGEVRPRPCSS